MSIDLMAISIMQIICGGGLILLYGLFCDLLGVEPTNLAEQLLSQFCGIFLFIGYFTVSIGVFGNSIGKNAMKLQIISEITGKKLTAMQAFQRSLGYLLSSWTYLVGFLMAYFRKDKKALHDLVCATNVYDMTRTKQEPQLLLPLNNKQLDYIIEESIKKVG